MTAQSVMRRHMAERSGKSMDDSSLEALRVGYENWYHVGNNILIGGLIAEALIVALVSDAWPRLKKSAEVIAAVVVLLGVWVEIRYGNLADEAANELRGRANERIAALNRETEALRNENIDLAQGFTPQGLLMYPPDTSNPYFKSIDDALKDIERFRGTPLFMQVVPDFRTQVLANDLKTALSGILDVHMVDESVTHCPYTQFAVGISLWGHVPLHAPLSDLSTPEAQGWEAGEALRRYLKVIGLGDSPHTRLAPTPQPAQESTCIDPLGFGVPPNAVVMYIGLRDVGMDVHNRRAIAGRVQYGTTR